MYSISLGFWWHIALPDKVIWCTFLYKKDNSDGLLILINIFEFVMIIINYCASLHVITTKNITEDPVRIYVDDALLLGRSKQQILMRLATLVEARLTVGTPMGYVQEVLELLNNTWHVGQKQFIVLEAQKLTGKLGHLAEGSY